MLFDLDKTTQGEAFKFFTSRIGETGAIVYDDPEPDAAVFYIRSMAPKLEEFQSKRRRKVEHVLNPQTRAMERLSYWEELTPDEVRVQREDTWDYVITGWENVLDAQGKPIEVNRENKLRLMRLPVFDRFVARCIQLLDAAGVQAQQASEGN